MRKSPTLTGEELLDARKVAAGPTQEDAQCDPGDTHGHNQGHDSEGAWRQDRQGEVTSDASELPNDPRASHGQISPSTWEEVTRGQEGGDLSPATRPERETRAPGR